MKERRVHLTCVLTLYLYNIYIFIRVSSVYILVYSNHYRYEDFILTPPEAITSPEVYIGNRLQHQYAGVWSVSIGIHHEQ